jgi:hypothetical protein
VKLSYRINMIYHVDTVSIDISISTLAQAYSEPPREDFVCKKG